MSDEKPKTRQRKKKDSAEVKKKEVVETKSVDNAETKHSETTEKKRRTKKDLYAESRIPPGQIANYRIWTRIIILGCVFVIAWFTSNRDKDRTFATRKESLIIRSQDLDCDIDYLKEISEYTSCMPLKCGRFVSDQLANKEDVDALLSLAKAGLAFGGANGGASILDLQTGALSKGDTFVNIYKIPEAKGFLNEKALLAYKIIRRKIMKAISEKFGIDINSLYLTHPSFFSRIDNATAKTAHDEYWHPHVDKETYQSFHYTSLLYLNEYLRDFDGGRFLFMDSDAANNTRRSFIEPKPGRVSVFTSGRENTHHIEKVTTGTRFAVTISFTCNRAAAIADPQQQ